MLLFFRLFVNDVFVLNTVWNPMTRTKSKTNCYYEIVPEFNCSPCRLNLCQIVFNVESSILSDYPLCLEHSCKGLVKCAVVALVRMLTSCLRAGKGLPNDRNHLKVSGANS